MFRKKRKMDETISLNVLVIPPESTKDITRRNIIVLKISPDDSVYQLKPMIKEHLHISFKEVEPTGIILLRANFEPFLDFDTQFNQYERDRGSDCKEMHSNELISRHFPQPRNGHAQPQNDRIHIIVTIE